MAGQGQGQDERGQRAGDENNRERERENEPEKAQEQLKEQEKEHRDEENLQVADPLAQTFSRLSEDEPLDEEEDGREMAAANLKEEEEGGDDGGGEDDGAKGRDDDAEETGTGAHGHTRAELERAKSAATDTTTVTTVAPADQQQKQSKPWYNPLRWGKLPPVPEKRTPSPEHTASFLSLLTFQWIAKLMSTGYKRPLELGDIYTVNPSRAVEPVTDRMRASFRRRVARGDKRPLLMALNETFFFEFWLGGFCQLTSTVLQVMSPFTLRFLIQFATDAYIASSEGLPPPSIGPGLGLVFGITAMQMLQSLGTNHFIYRGMLVGGMSRASLISLIYEKSMVISGRAKAGGAPPLPAPGTAPASEEDSATDEGGEKKKEGKTKGKSNKNDKDGKIDKKAKKGKNNNEVAPDGVGWGNGRVINLMSVDTYRVDQAAGLFHIIWTAPVAILITLVVLLINLTYSALAGFALLVIGVPLLTRAIQSLIERRKQINKVTDQRVGLTQEILQSVRFVKFFGWELSFLARLEEIRQREISGIQVLLTIRNAIMAISMSLPIFASMLSFITYSLTSHGLSPANVFSSLALFNSLRMPLNLLPLVIGQVTDAISSLGRIQEYLLAEEEEEQITNNPDCPNAVEMHDATFTWERTKTQDGEDGGASSPGDNKDSNKKGGAKPKAAEGVVVKDGDEKKDEKDSSLEHHEPFKLRNLDFSIGRKELVAVIGTVGSGKSSLLAALAGDMRMTDGEVVLGASRAFCPQYSWIQNTTVRNNIMFGKDMDRDWYREVIRACALQPDLDMLPNGDQTEIGERGITISGGQKQRLNIARAIYFDADIVLMDDPLSAVDAHVGRHIFDKAILGLLKDKCRILATHQLWVLSRCDRIVWMDGGRIQAIDTFDNLMKGSAGFRQLMESTAVEEKGGNGGAAGKKSGSGSGNGGDGSGNGGKAEEGDNDEDKSKSKKSKKKKGATIMQAEERAVASVPWSVYASYIRASGTIFNAPVVILLLMCAQGANIATSLWLSFWTSNRYDLSTGVYIGIYAGLGAVQALLMFCFMVSLSMFGTRASKSLLRQAITRCLRAPMSFFDTTPLGRITNRFSRDIDVMDNNLSDAMRMYFFSIGTIIAVFALIIAYFHYFAIALVPLFFFFLFATGYYRASAREVKRFEAVLRSTVFAKFGEGLTGIACIRAYGLQDRFVRDLRTAIDEMDSAYYLTYANQRWLSVRLDFIGNCLVFTTGILVVTSRFSVAPSTGGLVLSYILSIVQMIQFTVRQLAEVENGMNAVERILYYGTQLDEEAPPKTIDVRPSWPEKGEIVFDDVQMRYRAGLPLVLQGLSMRVRGGERVGIVGRTGAGKSSIMTTLFRIVELSGGRITVDGLDIATIGLQDLRSKLAIIPQDPTLFRGTVRSNLDPFGEHTDAELWAVLHQADLSSPAATTTAGTTADTTAAVPATTITPTDGATSKEQEDPSSQSATTAAITAPATTAITSTASRITLDTIVEEDGLNFSLGQRQLMALARALVRGSRIIVADEATSSVDMETDDKIQRTMATAFRGKTLLCIAHRLRTIIAYDRICVMDRGRIAELASPLELWGKEGGIFRGMCERSGIRLEDIRNAKEEMERLLGEQEHEGEGEGEGAAANGEEQEGEKKAEEGEKTEKGKDE